MPNNPTKKPILLSEEYITGCSYTSKDLLPEVKASDNPLKIDWEQILYSLTELSPFPIGIVCLKSEQILFKNKLLAPFFGIDSSQIFDKIIPELYAQPALWTQLVNKLKSGNLINSYAVEVKKTNGDTFKVQISAKVVNYEEKLAALFIFTNNTEQLKTQQENLLFTNTVEAQPADLLRDADTALYRAKEESQTGHIVFDTTMYHRAVTLLQLETDLRWAIERQELCLYYQPIICMKTGTITGFEALVRWQHPERGLISPGEFIPIAEETGLIIPIGQWVLTESCQQLRQWQLQFPAIKPLTVNVNLSGKQFSQPHLIEQITQILEDTSLNPSNLKLEITETAIIASPEKAASVLKQLKAFGLQVCIDDFGTGYSSLAYLHNFPIDVLKIDRSFINHIDSDTEQFAIVRAIATLADNLGMSVVAEGVETIDQLVQLKLLQCQQAQGYLFSKPLDQEQARILLASEQSFFRS
jgi:EAL domain-containing protein (putative c-di-GMP-specific phosphodiesterase class I)